MRREEESRQNILHSGGRSFWSLKKLMNIRSRMVTLSEKMTLLDIYSFLNHAGKVDADKSTFLVSYNSVLEVFLEKNKNSVRSDPLYLSRHWKLMSFLVLILQLSKKS
jgi:hypothetical protein